MKSVHLKVPKDGQGEQKMEVERGEESYRTEIPLGNIFYNLLPPVVLFLFAMMFPKMP